MEDDFGAILVAAPGGAVDEDDAFGDFDAFAGDAPSVSPGFADAFGGEALCAGEAASGEGAVKGGGTHGVARMGCENNPERLHQVDGPIDSLDLTSKEPAGRVLGGSLAPEDADMVFQEIMQKDARVASASSRGEAANRGALAQRELPGDHMGGVVTFCIDAIDQTLSYSRSFDSLPQTTATHLVFQRKDGRLSRLARCSNCRMWYPWTQSEEESLCDEQCKQACQCDPRVKMFFCKTCPFYYCGCDHFKSETEKHAKKGGGKDQQWREFRALLPEGSRDKPLTAVVDQLFGDASVCGADRGILLDGAIWLVPIVDRAGARAACQA